MHFIPDVANPILAQLDNREITLRDALVSLVAAVPSDYQKRVLDFLKPEPIRDGFSELLAELNTANVPFVVISSGLRFYIEAMLAPWRDNIAHIHALDVDTSGESMQLHVPLEHPTEAMPKALVMQQYQYSKSIIIGDSGSDIEMSKQANIVFARDKLIKMLDALHIDYFTYDTFYDIIKKLRQQGITHGETL